VQGDDVVSTTRPPG